ncbi:hypothetical protein ACPGAX_004537 [Enterobacter quasiroggenkampii]
MSEEDYERLSCALILANTALAVLWHFHPLTFITHFRKYCWLRKLLP